MIINLMRTRCIGLRQICQIETGPWGWGYSLETVDHRSMVGYWFNWKFGPIHLRGWDHGKN